MKLAQSRVTKQGQVSIPAEVRRHLGLAPGSIIEWDAEGDEVVVRRAGRYSSEDIHRTLFVSTPKRRTVEELRDGLLEHARRRHARG